MVFTGTKESCPNYNRDGGNILETDYQVFIDPSISGDPQ